MQLLTRDRRSLDVGFLQFGFERSEIQEYVRSVEPADAELQFATTREASAAPWLRNGQARIEPGVPTTWRDVASALAATLEQLSHRVLVIVSASTDTWRYVQFAGGPAVLEALAPVRDVVAEADERALRDVDWTRQTRISRTGPAPLASETSVPSCTRLPRCPSRRCATATASRSRARSPTLPGGLRRRSLQGPLTRLASGMLATVDRQHCCSPRSDCLDVDDHAYRHRSALPGPPARLAAHSSPGDPPRDHDREEAHAEDGGLEPPIVEERQQEDAPENRGERGAHEGSASPPVERETRLNARRLCRIRGSRPVLLNVHPLTLPEPPE
ncbi:hypothetical protein C5B85_03315 [Pseudoclavibacter sp. AY1F1]|nr:hypothetical protein C5B85_03315 [Pseudoclavibacter sp. AY1F1]